jgi:hypothetical protein
MTLSLAGAEEIMLNSLESGPGILPFKLGPTQMISHYHSFLQTIDLKIIRNNIESVKEQLISLTPQLHNKTQSLYGPHVRYLHSKLIKVSEQLQTFEPNRVKRGLIDGLGSVIKSISGNLDYTDALRYDRAIGILQENESQLATEFNSHISLNKQWITQNSKILNKLVDNQSQLQTLVNKIINSDAQHETELIKYAHLAQLLIIIGDNIEELSYELTRLENLLGFISARSTHHSMIKLDMFNEMVNRLKSIYKGDQILNLSFRNYFDIIKIGYYYNDKNLTLVFKFPVALSNTFILYKLSPVPNKNNIVLIPPYPYIAIHDKDFRYLEAECPKISQRYLCEDEVNHKYENHSDCIYQLIATQQLNESCRFASVTMTTGALEQLDDRHYIINLPTPTKLRLSCTQNQYVQMTGSYLAVIPKGCSLQTPDFTITNADDNLKGQVLRIMNLPTINHEDENQMKQSVVLNTVNLQTLHSINSELLIRHPVKINDVPNNDVIYHTTIPIYILLIIAVIIIISFALKHYLKRQSIKNINQDKSIIQGVYHEIPEKKTASADTTFSALFSSTKVK